MGKGVRGERRTWGKAYVAVTSRVEHGPFLHNTARFIQIVTNTHN